MKTLIIFFALVSFCYAEDFVYQRKPIDQTKILEESEKVEVKEALTREQKLIHKDLTPAKNDWQSNEDRGTVYFNSEKGNQFSGPNEYKVRNYSFHKVIIPDGTIIKGVNFSQKSPHTRAIEGRDLTFIECNLNNVELDRTWRLEHTLAIHLKHEIVDDHGKQFDIYSVEKDGRFEEVSREEIIP